MVDWNKTFKAEYDWARQFLANPSRAHYGISPHAGFPGSAAIRNADSWAFFAADCAGILTDSERNQALKIV